MLERLKQRWRDAGALIQVGLEAERIANREGHQEAAAEHLVLAALEMPDATARRALEGLRVDAAGFRRAIEAQHRHALRTAGIEPAPESDDLAPVIPVPPGRGVYRAQPSAQALMQTLAYDAEGGDAPFLSAHMLLAASKARYGVVSRAFRVLGIDSQTLAAAAQAKIDAHRAARG